MNIPSRELRNHTSAVLKHVQTGEKIVITLRGEPVAELVKPLISQKKPMPRNEFLEIIRYRQADTKLKDDLDQIVNERINEQPIR